MGPLPWLPSVGSQGLVIPLYDDSDILGQMVPRVVARLSVRVVVSESTGQAIPFREVGWTLWFI